MTNQNERMQAVLNEMLDDEIQKKISNSVNDKVLTEVMAASGASGDIFPLWGKKSTNAFSFLDLKGDNKVLVTNDTTFIDRCTFVDKADRFVRAFKQTKQKGLTLMPDEFKVAQYVRENGAKKYFWRECFVAIDGDVDYYIDDREAYKNGEGEIKLAGKKAMWAKALKQFRRHVVNTITKYKLKVIEGQDVLKKLMSKEAEENPEKFFNDNVVEHINCKVMHISDGVYAQFCFTVGTSLRDPFSDYLNFYTRPCEVMLGEPITE